jgi:hypothetical protein
VLTAPLAEHPTLPVSAQLNFPHLRRAAHAAAPSRCTHTFRKSRCGVKVSLAALVPSAARAAASPRSTHAKLELLAQYARLDLPPLPRDANAAGGGSLTHATGQGPGGRTCVVWCCLLPSLIIVFSLSPPSPPLSPPRGSGDHGPPSPRCKPPLLGQFEVRALYDPTPRAKKRETQRREKETLISAQGRFVARSL